MISENKIFKKIYINNSYKGFSVEDWLDIIKKDNYYVDNLPFDIEIKHILSKADFLRSKENDKKLWFADNLYGQKIGCIEPSVFTLSVEKFKEYGYIKGILENLSLFFCNCIGIAISMQMFFEENNDKEILIESLINDNSILNELIEELKIKRNLAYKNLNISDIEVNNIIHKSDNGLKNIREGSMSLSSVEIGLGALFALISIGELLKVRKKKHIIEGYYNAEIFVFNVLRKMKKRFKKMRKKHIEIQNEYDELLNDLMKDITNNYAALTLLIMQINNAEFLKEHENE